MFGAIESQLNRFNRSLVDELANRPGRLRSSVRMALITTLGAGLMAAGHVDSLLGLLVIWATVSSPAAKMKPAAGIGYILAAGVALAASMPLASALVEAPWLDIPFVAAVVGLSTYYLSDSQMLDGWKQVQLFFVNTFWIVIFDPADFGWSVGYNFGGAVVALGLIILFDNVLWPDPSEGQLLRSLEASLGSITERFRLIGRAYLASAGAVALPAPSTVGAMATHLALLARTEREGVTAQRYAVLFEAVSVIERLRLEVERILVIAGEKVPRRSRQLVQPELQAILSAIDSGLKTDQADIASGLIEQRGLYDIAGRAQSELEAYNRRAAELETQFASVARTDELSNLGDFVNSLQAITGLLIRSPIAPPGTTSHAAKAERARNSKIDLVRMRYCLKLAAATAAAFVVGLTAHRSDLAVILWTVIFAALPTFGASVRKMFLRFVGAAVGGLLALAAIILISPNFETVLVYMIVIFVALVPCGYVAAGGVAVAYAGLQAGVTFLLLFADLSPSIRDYEALWRLWGIFLGLIVVAIVFLLVWPEYAGDSMTPRLRRILHIAFELVPGSRQQTDVRRVRALEMEAATTLTELFVVADDARLEGSRCGIDPDRLVDAAGTLRRIAIGAGRICQARLQNPTPPLTPETQAVRDAFEAEMRARLQLWIDYTEGRLKPASALASAAEQNSIRLGDLLTRYTDRISASGYAELASWQPDARTRLLSEIDTFHRFVALAGELDDNLLRIPLPRRI